MKKVITIIIAVLIVGGIISATIFFKKSNKIPANQPEAIGNTSGNLNNGGYFCTESDCIYFSNFNDNHYLYKMNLNCSNAELVTDVPVSYINSAGDYLYFYFDDQGEAKFMGVSGNMRGIYRYDKKGKDDITCLDRCTSGIVSLIGNEVYYQHYDDTDGMTLYATSLDGKDKGMVLDEIINPACVVYGDIYYPNTVDNFYLYTYAPGSSKGSKHLAQSVYNPTLADGYIYYMNVADNYKLYRYDISQGIITKITSDRVDTFNVYENSIFYQSNTDSELIHVNADGSDRSVIAVGNYSNINCTPQYTFFTEYGDNSKMYMVPTSGHGSMQEFNP